MCDVGDDHDHVPTVLNMWNLRHLSDLLPFAGALKNYLRMCTSHECSALEEEKMEWRIDYMEQRLI
jgi:hypothetical protein